MVSGIVRASRTCKGVVVPEDASCAARLNVPLMALLAPAPRPEQSAETPVAAAARRLRSVAAVNRMLVLSVEDIIVRCRGGTAGSCPAEC